MRIAVLTGGGDVPGLNPAIKAIVNRAIDNGYEVLGIRRGWMGLLQINPNDGENLEWVMPLDKESVRRVDRTGGTFLHTSRTNPTSIKPNEMPEFLHEPGKTYDKPQDLTPHILAVIDKL